MTVLDSVAVTEDVIDGDSLRLPLSVTVLDAEPDVEAVAMEEPDSVLEAVGVTVEDGEDEREAV